MTDKETAKNGAAGAALAGAAAAALGGVGAADVDEKDRTLSIGEASMRFNIASRVLRTALGNGEVKGHDFGGRIGWRMKPEHVREWLDRLFANGVRAPKRRRRAKMPKKPVDERVPVKVGQVWRDRDAREGDRRVEVKEVRADVIVIHNPAHKDPSTRGTVKASAWHRRFVLVRK